MLILIEAIFDSVSKSHLLVGLFHKLHILVHLTFENPIIENSFFISFIIISIRIDIFHEVLNQNLLLR